MIALTVEGFLMRPVSETPIPLGKMFYSFLVPNAAVALISDSIPKVFLDNWLWMEGMSGHAHAEYPDGVMKKHSAPEYRVWQVNQLQRKGYVIEAVIDPDPEVCAALLKEGYTVFNFLHAQYAVPSWRPDYEEKNNYPYLDEKGVEQKQFIRPWEVLAGEVANQTALRMHDKRLEEQ